MNRVASLAALGVTWLAVCVAEAQETKAGGLAAPPSSPRPAETRAPRPTEEPAPSSDLPVAAPPAEPVPVVVRDAPAPFPLPVHPYRSGKNLAGTLGIMLSGSHLTVSETATQKTTSVGLLANAAAIFFEDNFSARGRANAFFGGGKGGVNSLVGLDVQAGGGVLVGSHAQLFARLDIEHYALKNDELESSTTFFGASSGVQIIAPGLAFDVGPVGGFTGRTEYEPGDESAGRRSWRRLDSRGAFGGHVGVYGDFLHVNASLLRIADSDPVTIADGNVCFARLVAVCVFGQYWRSVATDRLGQASTIPSVWLGVGLGIGMAESKPQSSYGGPR